MSQTVIRGTQILSNTIQRQDLDTSTVGQALVTKIVQGAGITLSSTGADSGTGDVTVNLASQRWSVRRTASLALGAAVWTVSHSVALSGCPSGAVVLITGVMILAAGAASDGYTRFSHAPTISVQVQLPASGQQAIAITDIFTTTSANQTAGQEAYMTGGGTMMANSVFTAIRLA